MARRNAIGRKYSVRLDKSVSNDLHKLRDRLAAAKAELSAIRADVVIATSPVRRSPPDPPRPTAVSPKTKPIKPVPPARPPVYSLRQAPLTRQPVVRHGPGLGVPARGAIAAGRKLGVGTKQQTTKIEGLQVDPRSGRQTAAVGKLPTKTGAATTRPVRPMQQKKPGISLQQPQQLSQKRFPPAKASPKALATGRPARTLERQKVPRTINPVTVPHKREVKKSQESSRPKDDRVFPVDVDKQYTMKKFMEQRESEISTSIATIPKKLSLSNIDHIVTEVAKDVSEVVDVEQLNQATSADDTINQLQSSWIEFALNKPTDQHQQLKSEVKFSDFRQPPQTTSQQLQASVKGTDNEEKQNVYVSKPVARYIDKMSTVQKELTNKDNISTEKYDMVKTAMSAEKLKGKNVTTEKDTLEVVTDPKIESANESTSKKVQATHSNKSRLEDKERVQESESFKHEPDKTKLDNILKDEAKQIVNHTMHEYEKKKEEETGYEAQDWIELYSDYYRESAMSEYDDHHTLSDDVYDDLPMSTEVPVSVLSDNDPELAALSPTSVVSHRDLVSPTLPFSSPAGDVEASQKTETWKYPNEDNPSAELVKVIDKERKTEIIIDLGDKKGTDQTAQDDEKNVTRNERSTSASSSEDDVSLKLKADNDDADSMLNEGSVQSLHDDDDDGKEMYWSGSDDEAEDELLQRDTFKEDMDEVDLDMKIKDSSNDGDKCVDKEPHCPAKLSHENEELEDDAPEKKATASADAGKMEECFPNATEMSTEETAAENDAGSTADEHINKELSERILSNAGLASNTELEHRNDFADDSFISAAISGAPSYLEREYGLPVLTPLDREEEPDEALRGEGPPVTDDGEAARLYSLGEDGLPDFGAEYCLGIETERSQDEERAGNDGCLLSEPDDGTMSKLIGVTKPERMDDEASILPEAAQSEEWDDTLYALSNPASAAEVQEPETRAEPGTMFDVETSHQSIEKTRVTRA